jgi:uncharacterized protein
MSEAVSGELIKKAFDTGAAQISFAFQGGEPTLAGLDYFKRFADLAERRNARGAEVAFSLQTNGVLIDGDWARFFRERNFLIGLSMDGDKDIHNYFRPDAKGAGSYNAAVRAAEILNRGKVDFNILSVVTDTAARHIARTYGHFKKLGFRYLQFIPCVEGFGGNAAGAPKLTSERYGEFLKTLFDLWLRDYKSGNYISIRHIDNYVRMLRGEPPETCSMGGACGIYFVVEGDGSLYPCDFYCLDEYRLKSVFDADPFELTLKHRRFLADSQKLDSECRECKYHFICRGGCKRDREPDFTHNKHCAAYKQFFSHALNGLTEVGKLL